MRRAMVLRSRSSNSAASRSFEIAQIRLPLLGGDVRQRRALIGHRGQAQGAALLLNGSLFQVPDGGLHAGTSVSSMWLSNWS